MAAGSNFLLVFVLGIGCACLLYSYRDSLGINVFSTLDEEKEVAAAWEKIIKKPSKHISSVVVGWVIYRQFLQILIHNSLECTDFCPITSRDP